MKSLGHPKASLGPRSLTTFLYARGHIADRRQPLYWEWALLYNWPCTCLSVGTRSHGHVRSTNSKSFLIITSTRRSDSVLLGPSARMTFLVLPRLWMVSVSFRFQGALASAKNAMTHTESQFCISWVVGAHSLKGQSITWARRNNPQLPALLRFNVPSMFTSWRWTIGYDRVSRYLQSLPENIESSLESIEMRWCGIAWCWQLLLNQ